MQEVHLCMNLGLFCMVSMKNRVGIDGGNEVIPSGMFFVKNMCVNVAHMLSECLV